MAFDLGVRDYIGDRAQKRKQEPLTLDRPKLQSTLNKEGVSLYSLIPDKDAYEAGRWSYDNAVYLSGLLINESDPANLDMQQLALRDFLSLYTLTQKDSAENKNGSWEELPIKNGEAVRTALFGSGQVAGGLITATHIGGEKAAQHNPYLNINNILGRLGVTSSAVEPHVHHFHIYLQPPELRPLPEDLQAGTEASSLTEPATSSVLTQTEAQGVLSYAQSIFEGDELMFMMGVPSVPMQEAPSALVQAADAASAVQTSDYILYECKETEHTTNPKSALRSVDPAGLLQVYLENRDDTVLDVLAIKTSLLEAPKHGQITSGVSNLGRVSYRYDPNQGYLGNDRAVFMAEFQGKRYKIVVELKVLRAVDDKSPQCPPPQLIKVNSKPVSGSSGYEFNSFSGYKLNSISITFGSLNGGLLGQTTGTSITLDNTAAGHGWYIDPTPLDNTDDYLPTSNPNIWQAKAGGDAAGKMDLLSVLLHEYGHALGLEHSGASGDFMAATLQPGQRRLPSAEELQLMSQLVAELKAGTSSGDQTPTNPAVPSLPLSALLLGRLALGRRPEDAMFDGSQALFAAHPTLQGGGLQSLQDWATQGNVSLAGGGTGGATLQESATSQTRLNQVFTINERDRFLSFTLAGTALDDVNGGPDDAFEVALLEADTGRSLTGALSLSHTDALLNLQANGTETAAANVTRVTNPDGSRTYRVDLAGVPAGTAVNLSFDLIGFGKAGSQVTVRDVRVSGLPELHDDAATLLEDSTLAFDPFAQVDNAALLALGSHVVEAPAHGSVSVNTDGTFVYTPQANYNGTDSYT